MRPSSVLPRVALGLGIVAVFSLVASRLADPQGRDQDQASATAPSALDADPGSIDTDAGGTDAESATPAASTAVPPMSATASGTTASPASAQPALASSASGTEVGVTAPDSAQVAAEAAATTDVPTTTTEVWPGQTDPDLVPATRERPPAPAVVSDPAGFAKPWGDKVEGLLTFRGNPTRSYHGTGPVPNAPQVAWRYPGRAMCGSSSEYGTTKQWCGTGWTGQPAVFERDGRTWLVFGAYDYKIHFVDAMTGVDIIPPFPTGDIAKGAITIDPDGYPLVYAGSRDNKYRVIAIDRPEPTELWSLDAHSVGPRQWNDDWDAAGLVHNDWLIEGGENSRVHLIKLNRGYGADGLVTAAPVLVWHGQGWDDELLRDIGDRRVSLESSVMILGDTAYFASSGGLVQGWDVSVMRTGVGEPVRTFRYWTGDDTDATILGDDQGFLYVGVEVDRNTRRAREVGQLLKLDPRKPDNPLVWSVDVNTGVDSGSWSSAVISGETVIWATKPGRIIGVNRGTGEIRWEFRVAGPALSSPSLVDGTLIFGDAAGWLRAYTVGDALTAPVERWAIQLKGNVESTPAIWKGRIYVGDRSGFMYAIADA